LEYAIYRFLCKYFMQSEHIPIRRHRLSGLDICDVTTDELEAIEREGADVGLDFQIAQFCLTLALSFLASTLSSPPTSDRVYTVFVVIIVVSFALGIIFGIKWWKGRGEFSRLIQKIKDRQIGPVGDEGKEIKPAELEDLPSQQASQT
jgi:hypothetical protein